MYTQCPDCKTAFRVAAGDLRQAAGKVRCGDCGAAFDALLYLSEDLPEPDGGATPEPVLPELKPEFKVDRPKLPESISANESVALLQTLDELAGSDVRIEDTGIEWRVLDDVALSEMGPDEAQLHDETSADDEAQADDHPDADEKPELVDQPDPDPVIRYDDDSPLPDELAADDNEPAKDQAVDEIEDSSEDPELPLAVDDGEAGEIDDSGDWEAILDDIDNAATDDAVGDELPDDAPDDANQEETSGEGLDEGDGEPAQENQNQDEIGDDESPDQNQDANLDEIDDHESIDERHGKTDDDGSTEDGQEEPGDDEIVLEGDEVAAEEADAGNQDTTELQPGATSDEDRSPSQWQLLDEDEQDEVDDSIPTLTEPHEISFGPDAHVMPGGGDDTDAEEDFSVESIVMEGDSVRFALDDMEAAASLRAAAASIDFSATHADAPPPKRAKEHRGGLLFLAFLLLLALGLQVVHQQRDTLAKIPAVNSIIGPLYRMVGKPLAPAWDVTGWSFEATSGNAEDDDQQLNIYTRIGNRSDEALPYPLIGVSLTDRFEEIIGSRVVEPSGYLPSNVNPRKLVAPGDSFEAFIAVESADAMASGYKLDVCYRLPDRRLRCALGDFR
jgi:predicted Zn finger-like uncharacterized protein